MTREHRSSRRRRKAPSPIVVNRADAYRRLVNPFLRQPALPAERIETIHDTALRVVEELGILQSYGDLRGERLQSLFVFGRERPSPLVENLGGGLWRRRPC